MLFQQILVWIFVGLVVLVVVACIIFGTFIYCYERLLRLEYLQAIEDWENRPRRVFNAREIELEPICIGYVFKMR